VPRLSIIVPHRNNDARLEMTLLSLLENRPEESEIILVHNGSYSNPYQLEDEVLLIAEDQQATTGQLLNAGVMAACSPVVCILTDGVVVAPNWSTSPVDKLISSQCAAVAVAVECGPQQRTGFGIDPRILNGSSAGQSGRVDLTRRGEGCIGPVLACGFYSRKVLLSLAGWNEALDDSVADVEVGLLLAALGLECELDVTSKVTLPQGRLPRKLSSQAIAQLASVAAAHGAVQSGWIPALQGLIRDCLQGRLSQGLAWYAGLRDTSTVRRTQLRLNHARKQLQANTDIRALRVFDDSTSDQSLTAQKAQRKAA
jgi:hypothetical protein